jgi:hypothetical protein
MLKFNKNQNPIQRVNGSTESTINNSLTIGQRFINGYNNIFQIVSLSDSQISLHDSYHGKTLTMSRKIFVQLYYRRNYTQIFTDNPVKEMIDSKSIGATRFMIKPEKFSL